MVLYWNLPPERRGHQQFSTALIRTSGVSSEKGGYLWIVQRFSNLYAIVAVLIQGRDKREEYVNSQGGHYMKKIVFLGVVLLLVGSSTDTTELGARPIN